MKIWEKIGKIWKTWSIAKKGQQKFWAWKWKFFLQKRHSEILVCEIFSRPPKTRRQVSAYDPRLTYKFTAWPTSLLPWPDGFWPCLCQELWFPTAISLEANQPTGVDLSKILGRQTKILEGKRWLKVINAWALLNYWGWHVPGMPPKSTPMSQHTRYAQKIILVHCWI